MYLNNKMLKTVLFTILFCGLQSTAQGAEKTIETNFSLDNTTISQSLIRDLNSSSYSMMNIKVITGQYFENTFVPGLTNNGKFVPGMTINDRFVRGVFVEGDFIPGTMNDKGTAFIPGIVYKGAFFPGMFNSNGTFTFGKLSCGRSVPGYVQGNQFFNMQWKNATVQSSDLIGTLEMLSVYEVGLKTLNQYSVAGGITITGVAEDRYGNELESGRYSGTSLVIGGIKPVKDFSQNLKMLERQLPAGLEIFRDPSGGRSGDFGEAFGAIWGGIVGGTVGGPAGAEVGGAIGGTLGDAIEDWGQDVGRDLGNWLYDVTHPEPPDSPDKPDPSDEPEAPESPEPADPSEPADPADPADPDCSGADCDDDAEGMPGPDDDGNCPVCGGLSDRFSGSAKLNPQANTNPISQLNVANIADVRFYCDPSDDPQDTFNVLFTCEESNDPSDHFNVLTICDASSDPTDHFVISIDQLQF